MSGFIVPEVLGPGNGAFITFKASGRKLAIAIERGDVNTRGACSEVEALALLHRLEAFKSGHICRSTALVRISRTVVVNTIQKTIAIESSDHRATFAPEACVIDLLLLSLESSIADMRRP